MRLLTISTFICVLSASVSAQSVLRIHSTQTRPGPQPPATAIVQKIAPTTIAATSCGTITAADDNDTIPGAPGSTLGLFAWMNPANSGGGRAVFFSNVVGSPRNQGIFAADSSLHPIVLGAGGGGGSGAPAGGGDPSPVGGTFAGLFGGSSFAPATNGHGDVLFVADIYQGTSTRGLFLYQAASGTMVKVAAVGDTTPLGFKIAAIGTGSMNDQQEVVFLSKRATGKIDILKWSAGVISKVVSPGDAAPGGGTFTTLYTGAFGFTDGTSIPVGTASINNSGTVAFFGMTSLGTVGIAVKPSGGPVQFYVKNGDPTPAGGTYFNFGTPNINNVGEVAFYADTALGGGSYSGGWFAGAPGNFRRVVMFYDTFGTGSCNGLAISSNPVNAIDDQGNVVAWLSVHYPNNTDVERVIQVAPNGNITTLGVQGQPAPNGGTQGMFCSWPAISTLGSATWGGFVSGAPGGATNAQFLSVPCNISIQSSSPPWGPSAGGTVVQISGTQFTGATSVTFGGTPASFTVVNDTTISAQTPAVANPGIVDIQVSGSSGSATLANAFDYFITPVKYGSSLGAPDLEWESTTPTIINQSIGFEINNFTSGSLVWLWAGDSNADWSGIPLPFDLTPFGLSNCVLIASAEYPFVLGDSNSSYQIPVPNVAAYVGHSIYFQAIVFDASTSVISSTNAYMMVLGN